MHCPPMLVHRATAGGNAKARQGTPTREGCVSGARHTRGKSGQLVDGLTPVEAKGQQTSRERFHSKVAVSRGMIEFAHTFAQVALFFSIAARVAGFSLFAFPKNRWELNYPPPPSVSRVVCCCAFASACIQCKMHCKGFDWGASLPTLPSGIAQSWLSETRCYIAQGV